MALVPVAPEAGGLLASLGLVVIGLLALLGWAFCRGALYGWKHTLGWLFEGLAGLLDFSVWRFHVDLGGGLRALDEAVIRRLGAWAAQSEHAAGYFFHGAAWIIEWATYETALLARDTYRFADKLLNHTLPRWAKYAVLAAFPPALLAALVYDAIRKEYPNLKRLIRAAITAGIGTIAIPRLHELERDLERLRAWLAKHKSAAAILGAVGGAVALPWTHIFPRLKAIERWDGLTKKRLRRLEKILGAAGAAAIMANALGLSSWRCITRGNIGRVSRALCGLSTAAIEDILGLLVDVFVLVNICETITLLEQGFSLIAGPLNDWIGTADEMFVHCNYDLPGALPDAALSLPPVTGVALSLPG